MLAATPRHGYLITPATNKDTDDNNEKRYEQEKK